MSGGVVLVIRSQRGLRAVDGIANDILPHRPHFSIGVPVDGDSFLAIVDQVPDPIVGVVREVRNVMLIGVGHRPRCIGNGKQPVVQRDGWSGWIEISEIIHQRDVGRGLRAIALQGQDIAVGVVAVLGSILLTDGECPLFVLSVSGKPQKIGAEQAMEFIVGNRL